MQSLNIYNLPQQIMFSWKQTWIWSNFLKLLFFTKYTFLQVEKNLLNWPQINLQHHVIREKKLSERDTLPIFYNVVR